MSEETTTVEKKTRSKRNTPIKTPTHKDFYRDEEGLLVGKDYIYNEDGTIDWKSMIPSEYIVINMDQFKGDIAPTDPEEIAKLSDREKLVLLGGIKEVAKLRGLISRETKIVESSQSRVVAECKLTFIPSYESNYYEYVYSDVASATTENVPTKMGQMFLETIASNRAFVRAVRNALRIDITGSDEVSSNKGNNTSVEYSNETVSGPLEILQQKAKEAKFASFAKFKDAIVKHKAKLFEEKDQDSVESWESWSDIPSQYVWILIKMLNDAINNAKK